MLRRLTTLALAIACVAVGYAAGAPQADAYLSRWYDCTLAPNTWCLYNERHSYSQVATGQYDWWTSTATDNGWWCSKLLNQDNGAEYGRVCDWGRWVTASINPPSSHMLPLSANGNNGSTQRIRGYARTP